MKGKLLQRFLSYVNERGPQDCWVWSGPTDRRYGRWGRRKAHRIQYERLVGPIPAGAVLRHACDTPLCCNPAHLEPGTQADNLADAVARGRTATGERNGRSTISEAEATYIRENPDGLSAAELGRRFGISKTAAHYIRTGRSWKVVGDSGIEPLTSAV
jgi:hypothetical protein